MTNHPNRSKVRYFKVSPRGFSNEVRYYRVREDQVTEVEAKFEDYEDREPGRYARWTTDAIARKPGVAEAWEDCLYAQLEKVI
ncbi:hypothetical protein GCM10019059_32370 [Camelimonas fluminis]|uniref:Uncharacterized protein n=1 Tax=Camelimonas fluminis TaxID=1576911 RepID=A0ABV7UIC1_9HYPH|nr:hypothetical protein [Camelimonas fluminis]GHE70088.1 hypothetical protein GCM10019059_32370 [Camelimonas fluminis]